MSSDTRQASTVDVTVERTRTMTVRVNAPEIPLAVLADLVNDCPNGVTVKVREIHGGSQREPEVVGYALTVDLLGGVR